MVEEPMTHLRGSARGCLDATIALFAESQPDSAHAPTVRAPVTFDDTTNDDDDDVPPTLPTGAPPPHVVKTDDVEPSAPTRRCS